MILKTVQLIEAPVTLKFVARLPIKPFVTTLHTSRGREKHCFEIWPQPTFAKTKFCAMMIGTFQHVESMRRRPFWCDFSNFASFINFPAVQANGVWDFKRRARNLRKFFKVQKGKWSTTNPKIGSIE